MRALSKNQLCAFIIIILILLVATINLGFGLIRNPNLIFDESNTLNIIKTNYLNIISILNKEQNIFGYYFIVSALYKIFNSYLVILIFHFFIWVLSIYTIFLLFTKYFNKLGSLLYTLLFSLITGFSIYSFFIRMYGLITIIVLFLTLVYIKYVNTFKVSYIFWSFALLLFTATLHPQFLFIILIFTSGLYINARESQHKKIVMYMFIISLLIFSYLILSKENIIETYFGSKVNYIRYQKDSYFNFFSHLYFKAVNSSSFLFGVLIIFGELVFAVKNYKNKKEWVFLLAILLSLLIPVSGAFKKTSMHYIFILPLSFIAFVRGITSLNKNYILMPVIIVMFCFSYLYSWKAFLIENYVTKESICKDINKLGDGVYITRFYIYNLMNTCINEFATVKKIIAGQKQFFDVTNSNQLEVLHIQSYLGGEYYIARDIGIQNVQEYVIEKYPGLPVYYIPSYDDYSASNNGSGSSAVFILH